MSKDAVHFMVLHLMTLALFVGSLLLAEHKTDGSQLFFAVATGVLLVMVVATFRDLYCQIKVDLTRE